MTAASYETDVVAWSNEQARLLRAGHFDRLDLGWQRTIEERRRALAFHLKQVPSLKPKLADPEWQEAIWADAVTLAIAETGMGGFPDQCPWAVADILAQEWLPAG